MDNLGIKLSWTFAAAFIFAAILGFIPNPVVGKGAMFEANTAHNLVHLITGVGFILVARMGNQPSIHFMLGFGVVYVLVGMVGFAFTGTGREAMLLGFIHINPLDNLLHIGLGIAILAGGLLAKHAMNASENADFTPLTKTSK